MLNVIRGMFFGLLFFVLMPWTLGNFLSKKNEHSYAKTISFRYGVGVMCEMALFYVISMPFIQTDASLRKLAWVFFVVIFLFSVVSAFFSGKSLLYITKYDLKAWEIWFFLAVVLFEIVVCFFYQPANYSDDATYVTMITTMTDNNTIMSPNFVDPNGLLAVNPKYFYTSYYQFVAVICYFMKIHPLIICKTLIPVLWTVPIYNMGTYLLSRWITNMDEKGAYLLAAIISVVSYYGGYTQFTISKRIFLYSWNGKAILAAISLPFLFWMLNEFFSGDDIKKREWVYILIAMLTGGASSLYGLMLSPIAIMLLAVVYALRNRNIKLVYISFIICCFEIPALLAFATH